MRGTVDPYLATVHILPNLFKGLEIIRYSNEVFKSVYAHAPVAHGWKASLNNSICDQIDHP